MLSDSGVFSLNDDYATREVDSYAIYVFFFAEDDDQDVGVDNDDDDGDIDAGDMLVRRGEE
jgi:hypothetical protein